MSRFTDSVYTLTRPPHPLLSLLLSTGTRIPRRKTNYGHDVHGGRAFENASIIRVHSSRQLPLVTSRHVTDVSLTNLIIIQSATDSRWLVQGWVNEQTLSSVTSQRSNGSTSMISIIGDCRLQFKHALILSTFAL